MKNFRNLVEKLVTGSDYFHQPHKAELKILNPHESYYYDLRKRINYPGSLKGSLPVVSLGKQTFVNPVNAAQYGLSHLQHYWDTGEKSYLSKAEQIGKDLIDEGQEENEALVWRYSMSVMGNKDWLSCLAQGQVASFLLRVGSLSKEELFIESAERALIPFFKDFKASGVQTYLLGGVWFEEYCISPPPFTLNGFIISFLALRDAALITGKKCYHSLYEEAINTLDNALTLFDLKGWSKYDLKELCIGRINLRNLASPFYHHFHVELLKIMEHLTVNSNFTFYRQKWEHSLAEGTVFMRAIIEKGIYRALNPVKRVHL